MEKLEEGQKSLNKSIKDFDPTDNENINKCVLKILEEYKDSLSEINNELLKDILFYGEVNTDKYYKMLNELINNK